MSSSLSGIMVAPSLPYSKRQPFYVADYNTLRKLVTEAFIVTVTGNFGDPAAQPDDVYGVFVRDANDTTTPEDGIETIVAANGVRWKRVRNYGAPGRGFLSLLDFIPPEEHAGILARTSEYDCAPALLAAVESVYTGAGFYWSGPRIFVPPGRYRMLSTFNLLRQVQIIGTAGSVASHDAGSEFSWPAGVPGFIVNAFNTNGLVDAPGVDPTTASSGTVIEGIRFIADVPASGWPDGHPVATTTFGQPPGNADAHGLRMRGMCLLRNCFFFGWQGNALHMVARDTPGGVGVGTGNINLFRLEGVTIHRSAFNGVFVDGSDSNAGYGLGVNCVQNGTNGIHDSSFLGNTWIACHANTNFARQYLTDNANAASVFLGCYSEIGGLASSYAAQTLVLGGVQAAGIDAGMFIQATATGGIRNLPFSETGTLSLGIASTGAAFDTPRTTGYALRMLDTTATTGSTAFWSFNREVGRLLLQRANVGGSLALYDPTTTVANGFARNYTDGPMSSVGQLGLNTHFFGNTKTQMRFRGLQAALPVSGEYISGDVLWKLTMVAGNYAGWVCTTSGTAGSTAVFKEFGAILP